MIVESCLIGLGLVLFGVGYFRKSRNLMLLGMVVLLAGVGGRDALAGWRAAG